MIKKLFTRKGESPPIEPILDFCRDFKSYYFSNPTVIKKWVVAPSETTRITLRLSRLELPPHPEHHPERGNVILQMGSLEVAHRVVGVGLGIQQILPIGIEGQPLFEQ